MLRRSSRDSESSGVSEDSRDFVLVRCSLESPSSFLAQKHLFCCYWDTGIPGSSVVWPFMFSKINFFIIKDIMLLSIFYIV